MVQLNTKHLSILLGLGFLLLICWRINAEEPDISSATFDGEDGFYLYAFREKSILIERGISCDSFLFGTDSWIMGGLVPKPEFKAALAKVPDVPEYLINKDCATPTEEHKESDGIGFWLTPSETRDRLLAMLSEEEACRLPYVYLRLEGFIALIRPQFRKLYDKPESQDKVEKLVREYAVDAGLFYGRLMSSPPLTEEDFLVCRAGLRRLSADLDREIYKFLSAEERKRVASLLKVSSELDRIVVPPPLRR